jgi:hypothetical protein
MDRMLTREIWRPDMLLRCWTSEITSGGTLGHSAARRIIDRILTSWIDTAVLSIEVGGKKHS